MISLADDLNIVAWCHDVNGKSGIVPLKYDLSEDVMLHEGWVG